MLNIGGALGAQGEGAAGLWWACIYMPRSSAQSHPPVRYGCVLPEGNVMV